MNIGIYYIATSNYKEGFKHFMQNIKCLFPNHHKTIFVLSDGLQEWNGYKEAGITCVVHNIQHFPWPIITLFKMKYILDYWDDTVEYVFYFNGNLQYNPQYGLPIINKLCVSTHCFSSDDDCYDGHRFANINEHTVAYIDKPYKYVHGGLFLGPSPIVKKMCKEVCRMCEMDLQNNIIPQWHDESYLNKWCSNNEELVIKQSLIAYGKFDIHKPFAIIETIKKDRRIGKVYLPTPLGRFANRLYEVMAALSYGYKHNKEVLIGNGFLPQSMCMDIECYDAKYTPKGTIVQYDGFNRMDIPYVDTDCIFYGYFQNINLIDLDYCKKIIKCPTEIEEKITSLYPDIKERVCLHVRRGDYLHGGNEKLYQVLSKEYIERVVNKYFPDDKILCISDDIEWCEQNLSELDITFSKGNDYLIDFWLQTKTKSNICSCSSFSCMGALLNSNKNCIVPTPYYKNNSYDLMVPSWAKRENI